MVKRVTSGFKCITFVLVVIMSVIIPIRVKAAEYIVPSYNVRFTLPKGMEQVDFVLL